MCVFACALRLYPARPGWGVRCGRVCLGSGFGCALPLLAWVCCVAVCAWAWPSCYPRHSWLGCLVVCVCLCLRSACTPPLLAGLCSVGVCAWPWVSAAPRHSWLGCWGSVCACVRALLVPCHSWLGCAVWACVLGLRFRLVLASPGWAVRVCGFVCALCLYPANPGWGVTVGVCARARVSAAPRHSCLGCWGSCVFVCALRLYPATPGWGVRCGCVRLGSGFGCTTPLLAGLCGVGVCAGARVSAAPRHSLLGCLGVCVCVRIPLIPRQSWLGCALGVCVLGLGFRLRPATPGWGVGVRVCLCARSACTPPLLAGLCGVGVCA